MPRLVACAAIAAATCTPHWASAWEPSAKNLDDRFEVLLERTMNDPSWRAPTPLPTARPKWADKTSWFEGTGEQRIAFSVGRSTDHKTKKKGVFHAEQNGREVMRQLLVADLKRRRKVPDLDVSKETSHYGTSTVDWYYDRQTHTVSVLTALECPEPDDDKYELACDQRALARARWRKLVEAHPTRPAWANKTTWFEGQGATRRAYAVGVRSNIMNRPLFINATDNKARSQMSMFINGYWVDRKVTKNGVSTVIASSGMLTGVSIVDRYFDAKTKTLASLASMLCPEVTDPKSTAPCGPVP